MQYAFSFVLATVMFCGSAVAAEFYTETWDNGSIEGWSIVGSTAQGQHHVSGGNPDGYVRLWNTSSDIIQFTSTRAELTGDLAAAGIMHVAVDLHRTTAPAAEARLRFITVGDAGLVSGWRCTIVNGMTNDWQTYAIAFDPTWTDQEAEAAGWFSGPTTVAGFADTLSNVVEAGLQFFGMGETEIGVDNFAYAACDADVNLDGTVDVLDLLAVLAAWGATGGPDDINGDGIVNVLDLLEVLAAWGPC